MAIDFSPLYRHTVGYDRLPSLLEAALRANDPDTQYPPYNIEAVGEDRYAISLAVAGFAKENLDINVENGVLTITGRRSTDVEHKYLHQGIVQRPFTRKFNLAEHVEVEGAQLRDGLLTVRLLRQLPEALKPKRISIDAGSSTLEHQPDEQKSQQRSAA